MKLTNKFITNVHDIFLAATVIGGRGRFYQITNILLSKIEKKKNKIVQRITRISVNKTISGVGEEVRTPRRYGPLFSVTDFTTENNSDYELTRKFEI